LFAAVERFPLLRPDVQDAVLDLESVRHISLQLLVALAAPGVVRIPLLEVERRAVKLILEREFPAGLGRFPAAFFGAKIALRATQATRTDKEVCSRKSIPAVTVFQSPDYSTFAYVTRPRPKSPLPVRE